MMKYIVFLLLLFSVGITSAYIISTFITHSQRVPVSSTISLPDTTPDHNQPVEERNTIVLFGGDMMFDRSIRQHIEKQGINYIFSELNTIFSEADIVVANLEGPITDNDSVSVNSEPGSTRNFIFTFSPEITSLLKQNNMIVNIGNNHIANFGDDGITQTKKYLTQENIPYFGDTGLEDSSQERILFHTANNKNLVFINYNQFTSEGLIHALEDISFSKTENNIVIVYTHWGNEYNPIANTVTQNQAHQFIDAGADVIIGSHPHVIQQKEIYKDKVIYYSLGNLVFDQYFSQETKEGLLVKMSISKDNALQFTELNTQTLVNGQTVLNE